MTIPRTNCTQNACTASTMGTCTYTRKIACGGDGFAFVFQSVGPNATGTAGSGLGYAGIQGAVAIEFDAVRNDEKNDPKTDIERHISLIVSPSNYIYFNFLLMFT